jgi:hypothetical protein
MATYGGGTSIDLFLWMISLSLSLAAGIFLGFIKLESILIADFPKATVCTVHCEQLLNQIWQLQDLFERLHSKAHIKT